MSWKSLGSAWAHSPLEYFTSSSPSFCFRSRERAAGEDGGLGEEEEEDGGVIAGGWGLVRGGGVVGGLCGVGECEGLSVGVGTPVGTGDGGEVRV